MSLKGAIGTLLLNAAGVTGYTGTGSAALIWSNNVPPNTTMPTTAGSGMVVFKIVDGESLQAHDGSAGLGWKQIQFDSYAARDADAEGLADQVRLAIQGFQGIVGGVEIQGILAVQGIADFFEPTGKVYRYSQDFKVWHTEAQPS